MYSDKRWVDVMDIEKSKDSLGRAKPPANLPPPLRALWHHAKGDWDSAHGLMRDDKTQAAAWVHAFLHRVEGDEANAAYWYGIAGRAHCANLLSSEWLDIAGQLLEAKAEPALEMDH
jgi:hypothetical protein